MEINVNITIEKNDIFGRLFEKTGCSNARDLGAVIRFGLEFYERCIDNHHMGDRIVIEQSTGKKIVIIDPNDVIGPE